MAQEPGTTYKSPLHKMVCTSPTDLWNDSCSIDELKYAISHGAVGATTNPVIVGDVLNKEMPLWEDRIEEIIRYNPTDTEDEITWKVIEELATKGAELFLTTFDDTNGQKGRLSIQTNPKFHSNVDKIVEQTLHFETLAPNMQVKIPATAAGIEAIEEVTFQGVSVNATVSFSVSQAIAVAEAVERGLRRREDVKEPTEHMSPVCTIMVGRIDDWLRVAADRDDITVDPGITNWAGVAIVKKAYALYQQRGYRSRLLAAAYRCHMHWSEFVGGDMVVSIPHQWQVRFNQSGIDPIPRMDNPVDETVLSALQTNFKEFNKAYDEDGMTESEFDTFGPTQRTLRQFLQGYDSLVQKMRDRIVLNPDVK